MKLMITIKGDSLLIQLLDVVFWLFHVWSFWWWLPTSWISWKSQILCPILPVVCHFIWLSLPWLLLLLVLEEVSLFSKDWPVIHVFFLSFQEINIGLVYVNLPVNSYLAFVPVCNYLAIFPTVYIPMELEWHPHPPPPHPHHQTVKTCQK